MGRILKGLSLFSLYLEIRLPVAVPVNLKDLNLKDRNAFHLTIEEYLHALISLIEELVRMIG